MNSVHLIGRLTRDPELQYGGSNKTPYCNFTLAVDRGKNKNGESSGADFPRVTAFGKTAENMAKYVEKGNLICVDASVHTDVYEKDGQKRYQTELLANRVQFLQWKKNDDKEVEEIPKTLTEFTTEDLPF